MNQWNEQKRNLINQRGDLCEWCQRRRAEDAHHIFIKRRYKVNDERNVMLVCTVCHASGQVDNYLARCYFWAIQKERYPDLEEWYENLPLLIKEHFDGNEIEVENYRRNHLGYC
jgi:hypothetical protein